MSKPGRATNSLSPHLHPHPHPHPDPATHPSGLVGISSPLLSALVTGRPNVVYVASNHFVWRLVPVSISSQIRQLLQDKQFELALQLAVSATCRPQHAHVLREAKTLKTPCATV